MSVNSCVKPKMDKATKRFYSLARFYESLGRYTELKESAEMFGYPSTFRLEPPELRSLKEKIITLFGRNSFGEVIKTLETHRKSFLEQSPSVKFHLCLFHFCALVLNNDSDAALSFLKEKTKKEGLVSSVQEEKLLTDVVYTITYSTTQLEQLLNGQELPDGFRFYKKESKSDFLRYLLLMLSF